MRYSSIFFRFLRLLGKVLPLFLFAMIIHMVGDNFLYLTLSYFVDRLIDMAQIGSMDGIGSLIIGCIAANVIALVVFFVFGALYDIYAKEGNAIVQKMMIEKLMKLPMAYFDKHVADMWRERNVWYQGRSCQQVKTEYETCSNNEWQEVSRGHSTIVVANMVGRTEL